MLPEREERTFWIDGEVLRAGPPPGGLAGRDTETVVDGGWLLPGLVDVHTHPGALEPGSPFDEALLRRQLGEHRDSRRARGAHPRHRAADARVGG